MRLQSLQFQIMSYVRGNVYQRKPRAESAQVTLSLIGKYENVE